MSQFLFLSYLILENWDYWWGFLGHMLKVEL